MAGRLSSHHIVVLATHSQKREASVHGSHQLGIKKLVIFPFRATFLEVHPTLLKIRHVDVFYNNAMETYIVQTFWGTSALDNQM